MGEEEVEEVSGAKGAGGEAGDSKWERVGECEERPGSIKSEVSGWAGAEAG